MKVNITDSQHCKSSGFIFRYLSVLGVWLKYGEVLVERGGLGYSPTSIFARHV